MNVRPGLQMYNFRVDLVDVNRFDISELVEPIIFNMEFQVGNRPDPLDPIWIRIR